MGEIARQRGMSGWGVLLLLVVIGFGSVIGLKLAPVYIESFKIDKALKGVISDPELGTRRKQEIKYALIKRFDIDDVKRVSEKNFKDTVTITKKGKKVSIDVEYRAEKPLFGNISVVVDFAKHVEN